MNASASDPHRLHNRLEQLLGPEDAATLMEHLPPDEWNQLATKDDLRTAIDGLRQEMRDFERRITEHVDLRVKATVGESTRLLFFSLLASQATMVGLVLAAVKLG
ncbi:MAG: hypothetical protein JWN67_292 [Actinomycetia bacterium]|nr:hypothetical protein [Actinomycetes bacterium]